MCSQWRPRWTGPSPACSGPGRWIGRPSRAPDFAPGASAVRWAQAWTASHAVPTAPSSPWQRRQTYRWREFSTCANTYTMITHNTDESTACSSTQKKTACLAQCECSGISNNTKLSHGFPEEILKIATVFSSANWSKNSFIHVLSVSYALQPSAQVSQEWPMA